MKRALSLLLITCLIFACVPTTAVVGARSVGNSVFDFSSEYLDGSPVDGSIFADHTVSVVTYWATWEGSSLYQLPFFQQVYEAHPNMGVFGLLHEDGTSTVSSALSLMNEEGYTFPCFTEDSVWRELVSENAYIPQCFFVDSSGTVLEIRLGAFSEYSQLLDRLTYWVNELDSPPTYTVTFLDGLTDETILAMEGVEYGSAVTPPRPPDHVGYHFTSWSSTEYNYVVSDLFIVAGYEINQYRIRFSCSMDNAIISTIYVPHGEDATAPRPHSHDGYQFIGWDNEFTNVTCDMIIYALYDEIVSEPDGDIDGNGIVNTVDALIAIRIAIGSVSPTDNNLVHGDFDGNGLIELPEALTVLRLAMTGV